MAKTQFLSYYICLDDAAEVAANQAQQWIPAVTVPGTIPVGVVNRAITPNAADTEFNAPFRGFTQPLGGGRYIWTPWSGIGEEDGPFPLNVASFTRKTGGFWIFGGTKVRYYWMGTFVYSGTAPGGPGVPAVPEDLTQVYWADGFELPGNGEGGTTAAFNDKVSPDASRHLGGYGCAIRGFTGTGQKIHRFDENGAALPSEAWTRCYIRLRRAPDTAGYWWDCRTTTSGTAALALKFTSSRTLAVYTVQSTVLAFSTALPFQFDLDRWYRIDILLKCGLNPPNDGRFRMYVDGVKIADILRTDTEGLGGGGLGPVLQDVRIGHGEAVAGLELDVDDWSGHFFPNGTDEGWTGVDWQNGSRIIPVRAAAFGANHSVNWAGSYQQLLQRPVGTSAAAGLVSTTSGAAIEVDTDFGAIAAAAMGSLGCLALNISVFHVRASGTVNSQLGYALDGSTYVDASVQGTTTELWKNVVVSRHGVGIKVPTAIPDLQLRFLKSADVTSVTVRALFATALMIGQFGAEDAPPGAPAALEGPPLPAGMHDTPYPTSPWALSALPPLSPVLIVGGTYAGNSLAQDLALAVPAHFYWVRPLTGGAGGVQWWSTMLGSHLAQNEGTLAEAFVYARMNGQFNGAPPPPGEDGEAQAMEFTYSIAGANTQANVSGVTFQFIAFCDPGQRNLICGAFQHGASPATAANPLADSGFTPELAFFQPEAPNNTTTDRQAWKGPGHGTDEWQVLSAAAAANAIEFGAGVITSKTVVHANGLSQVAYAAFRNDDGIDDASGNSQAGKSVQMWTYTGDGAASRTIAFRHSIGKRPLFAIIGPTNGTVYFRDPSNTSNTSQQIGGTNSTTAITGGGIDSISLGVTLNSNGVVYNVFMIPAGTGAGNGGWGTNGTYIPVEPDTPVGDQWDDPFPGEPTAPVTGGTPNPLDPGDLSTDIAADCVASSTRLVNLALVEAGITKQLANLATDTSEEAFVARLVYKTLVDAVLRSYAWNFARTYSPLAGLTLVAGTSDVPVNPDWTFSYAVPSDSLRVLRVLDVAGGTRRADSHTPIAFAIIQDDTPRDLLLTNEPEEFLQEDDPVRIEYIRRVPCPGRVTDAVFRQCLIFRLGAAFAAGIAKDEKKADALLAKFRDLLPQDKVLHANEQERQRPTTTDPDWITGR